MSIYLAELLGELVSIYKVPRTVSDIGTQHIVLAVVVVITIVILLPSLKQIESQI